MTNEINPFIIELIEIGNEYKESTCLFDKNSTREDIRINLTNAFKRAKEVQNMANEQLYLFPPTPHEELLLVLKEFTDKVKVVTFETHTPEDIANCSSSRDELIKILQGHEFK